MNKKCTVPSAYENAHLDRGALTISGRKKKQPTHIIIALVMLALVVFVIGVLLAVNQFSDSETAAPPLHMSTSTSDVVGVEKGMPDNDSAWFEKVKREHQLNKAQRTHANDQKQTLKRAQSETEPQRPVTLTKPYVPTPTVVQPPAPTSTPDHEAPLLPQERRLASGVMVNVESGNAVNSQTSANTGPYDSSYNAPAFVVGNATKRKRGSLNFLLQHGTILPCALYSQIISDYQGIVTCRITQDVYSANGKALLIERGSLLTGSQNVQLDAGKNRVFTAWADIETPNGIAIRIDSLGAGRLGASGSEAWVDQHFKARFGGAILLSFLDDAFSALANKTAGSNSDITFDSSTENASDMAEKALESTINVSPTGYTKIGQRINIIVARDIDMSSVYAFE